MAEPHPRTELDQPVVLGRRAPHQVRSRVARRLGASRLGIADGLGGGDQQAAAASAPAAPRLAGRSSARSAPPTDRSRAVRSHPPARQRSSRAAAPAGRAGCRGSRRRSGPAPARPAARHDRIQQRPSIAVAQAIAPSVRAARPAPADRSAHGRRTPARPTRPVAAAPRTRGPAPRPGPATARRRPSRRAAAPRRRPTTAQARPGRPGIDPARRAVARPNAVPRAPRCGSGSRRRGPTSARTAGAGPANASSISDSTPAARTTRHPELVLAR